MQGCSNQLEVRQLSGHWNALIRHSTAIAYGIRELPTLPSNAISSEGPWELHHSRAAKRRTVRKGDETTRGMIYAKINTRFKEVF
jgi:hypothetical protein